MDESIRIAEAIQLCGFPSVIATLWQVNDLHTSVVSKDVYDIMLKADRIDSQRSAEGLHWAVRCLEKKPVKYQGSRKRCQAIPLFRHLTFIWGVSSILIVNT